VQDGVAAGGALDSGFPSREDEAGCESLDIKFEGATYALIKVVDIEVEAAVDSGVSSEIEDVGVAAELGGDAGVGMAGEVGGHDRSGSAKEAKGAGGHALILDGDKAGDAALHGGAQDRESVEFAGCDLEVSVLAAGELLACAEAEGVAIGVSELCNRCCHGVSLRLSNIALLMPKVRCRIARIEIRYAENTVAPIPSGQ